MKRTIIILIALLPGIYANAQTWNIGTPNAADVKATLSNDTLYVRGTGDMMSFSYPYLFENENIRVVVVEKGVTNIGESAFSRCSKLHSVVLPEGITTIGTSAFYESRNLSSIVLPKSITNIESMAFYSCTNLSSILIPENVTKIGSSAFSGCTKLSSIVIPAGVTYIADLAFYYCSNLSSLVLPEGITDIRYEAFGYCSNLSSIVLPASVTNIGYGAFLACGKLSSVTSLNSTPPVVSSYGNFTANSKDTLYVPCGSLDAYQNAPVWQDFDTIIEDCPIFKAGVSNVKASFSCPGQVTVTYCLNTTNPTDVTLYYSPDGGKTWLIAQTVSGDLTTQTTGTGKTIVWDNRADHVRWGNFKLKVDVPKPPEPPEPECVIINGLCWATRNVADPGHFVNNPEDYGNYYTWQEAQNVCPSGFRVPTFEEAKTLPSSTLTRPYINGVLGFQMTEVSTGNSIFFPFSGGANGYNSGYQGIYWTSTYSNAEETAAYALLCNNGGGYGSYTNYLSTKHSVRCIKE